jgi:hypothetical protein
MLASHHLRDFVLLDFFVFVVVDALAALATERALLQTDKALYARLFDLVIGPAEA